MTEGNIIFCLGTVRRQYDAASSNICGMFVYHHGQIDNALCSLFGWCPRLRAVAELVESADPSVVLAMMVGKQMC